MTQNAGQVGNAGQVAPSSFADFYAAEKAKQAAAPSNLNDLFGLDAATANQQVTTGSFTTPGVGSGWSRRRTGARRDSIINSLSRIGGLTDEEITALQERMFAAGYYGTTPRAKIHWGQTDTVTYHAFLGLLIETAQENVTDPNKSWEDLLTDRGSLGVGVNGSGATITVPNAEETYQIVQQAAQSLIGKKMDETEARSVASRYIASYTASQQASAALGEGGGTVTAPQSIGSFVESTVDPNEAAAHNLASGVFAAFASTLDGIGD